MNLLWRTQETDDEPEDEPEDDHKLQNKNNSSQFLFTNRCWSFYSAHLIPCPKCRLWVDHLTFGNKNVITSKNLFASLPLVAKQKESEFFLFTYL